MTKLLDNIVTFLKNKSSSKCNHRKEHCCQPCDQRHERQILILRIKGQRKLDQQNEKLTARISHLQKVNKQLEEKVVELKRQCPVCLESYHNSFKTNPVVLDPCGHCICTNCEFRMITMGIYLDIGCPVCRNITKRTIPLFM